MQQKQFIPISYLVLLLLSGILKNPYTALLIATIYEVGFIGLLLIYNTHSQPQEKKLTHLIIGLIMILFCVCWLEIALVLIR